MENLVADFTIENNNPFELEFDVLPSNNFDCIFEIDTVKVVWGGIEGDISDQTDLYNELDTLSSQIDGNHQEISNIHNTIQGYGDIVSYDAADFATSIQGGLADTALQPNDNISELNNDVGYITSSSLPTVNNNTITIQKNGTDVESFTLNQNTNKSINITVPTNTNELTNGAGFITSAVNNLANYYLKSETYTKTEVQQLIASIPQFRVLVVQSLPQEGEPMVLYLVPKEGETPDVYNEYIWIEDDEDYELIGNTAIDLTDYVKFTDLATVATTGDYDDLINQPTIGNGTITFTQGGVTKGTITTNQSGNTTIDFDAGGGGGTVDQTFDGESANAQSGVAIAGELTNYLSSSNTVETNTVTLATVATSGDYDDLINQPTIPTATSELTNDSGFITSTALTPYALISSLSTVATSGSYTDLSDKPTIGNGTITFTQGGVTKGTITTNQSGNTTIDFDAGGGGAVDSVNGQTGVVVLTASDVGALPDSTTIPTMTSQLTNDSGFITNSALTNYVTTNTAQDISGRKTFLGEKAIYFKQSATTDKLGFTLYNPSGTELSALEYRPNTISGSALLALNTSYANSCYVGFRYWGTAVNIVAPKVATAGDYYIPTHITNGNTTVTASNNGTVNISTLLPTVGNGTITINQGGTQKGTFTVNQSGDTTINLDAGSSGGGTWGSITGTLSDQTDLQNALNAKLNVSDITEYTAQEVETLWGNI